MYVKVVGSKKGDDICVVPVIVLHLNSTKLGRLSFVIMSSIHLKRAKAWQTTEFNAEWIQNAVEYCQKDPEGKRGFEAS